jgi:hypothetical protein
VLSSTIFINWSKPRSTPVTCRLAFNRTAESGTETSEHRTGSAAMPLPHPHTAKLLVHHALELGRLYLDLQSNAKHFGNSTKRHAALPPAVAALQHRSQRPRAGTGLPA